MTDTEVVEKAAEAVATKAPVKMPATDTFASPKTADSDAFPWGDAQFAW